MAKKTVATLKQGQGKEFVRVVKMIKNERGSYSFREEIVHKDHVKDFFGKK